MDEINASEVGQLLRGRMGLIIGPGVTKFPGSLLEVRDELARRAQVVPEGNYLAVADAASEKGHGEAQIRE